MSKRLLLLASVATLFYMGCKTLKNENEPKPPAWKQLEEMNIIPCPKIIERHSQKKVSLTHPIIIIPEKATEKIKIAAGLIADKFEKIQKVKPLIISSKNALKDKGSIRVELKLNISKKEQKYPLGEQGYAINASRNRIELSANGEQGLLYAAVTFNQIITQNKGGEATFPNLSVIDWPDFKNRCADSLSIKRFSQGKKLVDWLLKYKYNWVLTPNRIDNTPGKDWPKLRKVNEYARARGVNFIYCASWSIGDREKDAGKPEYKGCLCFNGRFYCWSRDALINKTALEYVKFINATKPSMVNFHCLDSTNENWPERCEECKKRFGDDRVSADANVINILTETIRKDCKDVKLGFVTQPYGIDVSLPGNRRYFEFYKKLTNKIPSDVALNQTGYNKDAHLAINKAVIQPVIRWQNGSSFQAGRFFTTEPRLFKGVYFPKRQNDIAFINEPFGSFREGNAMLLTGIEYMWNTEAPGASEWRSNKSCPVEKKGAYDYQKGLVDGKTIWGHGGDGSQSCSDGFNLILLGPPQTSEILLKRVCICLYGDKLAPFMYDFYRIGIVGWWGPRKALDFAVNEKSSDKEYRKCLKAQSILQKALKTVSTKEEKNIAERFLKRMVPLGEFYRVNANLQKEQKAVRAGKYTHSVIANINQQMAQARKKMLSSGIDAKTISYWLAYHRKQLQVLEAEVQLRKQMQDQKKKKGLEIAIYYPNLRDGKVVGAKTILKILSTDKSFAPVFIDNLKEDELKKYKVLIIPHVKKFAKGDESIYRKNIQEYVKKGGGAYFEHDSVGFYRGVLQESVFPEICKNGFRRKEFHDVIANGDHPCLNGIKKKAKQKHLYWDHIALTPGSKGIVLLTDQEGHAVGIAGNEEKGRVVFSGMITYPSEKNPSADPAKHIDQKFLINSVNWLARLNSPPSQDKTKKLKKIYDSSSEVIQLNLSPEKKYAIWLSPLFKLEKNKEYLVSFELKKDNSCRFIPIMDLYEKGKKIGKEYFIDNFPYSKEIKNFQKFSGIFSSSAASKSSNASVKLFFDWFKNKQEGKPEAEIKNISIYEMESKK